MHLPILELLKLESEKIKLKTLSVIEGFDGKLTVQEDKYV